MSLSCQKMNYSLVPNKWNKCSHLLFSKKYLSFGLPPLLLSLEHPLNTHTHTHTHTYTHSRTHITYWFFIFFRKKIRKMRFKFSNEVRKQWLIFLYTLICIVLSQFACRLFVKLRYLNQIRQISPSSLLILFWWIFQSQLLIKVLGYWGPRSRVLVFWKLQNMSYLN